MSEKIKYTIKELKQPDKFRQFISDLVDTAAENFNKILYAVGGIVVLLIVIILLHHTRKRKHRLPEKCLRMHLYSTIQATLILHLKVLQPLIKEHPSQQAAKLAIYYTGILNYDLGQYEKTIASLNEYLK